MTKSYDMVVLIENYDRGNERAIKQAVEDLWDLECPVESWSDEGDGILEGFGCCSLYANDRPADFASRVAENAWKANDGYCDVGVVVVQPGLWAEKNLTYRTEFADYRRWILTGELPYLGEASRGAATLARAA